MTDDLTPQEQRELGHRGCALVSLLPLLQDYVLAHPACQRVTQDYHKPPPPREGPPPPPDDPLPGLGGDWAGYHCREEGWLAQREWAWRAYRMDVIDWVLYGEGGLWDTYNADGYYGPHLARCVELRWVRPLGIPIRDGWAISAVYGAQWMAKAIPGEIVGYEPMREKPKKIIRNEEIHRMREDGCSHRQIAKALDIGKDTVTRVLKRRSERTASAVGCGVSPFVL
jgi:hypothetical protein